MAYSCVCITNHFASTVYMADVIVSTTIPQDTVDAFVKKVYETCKTDVHLSYRSMLEISTAYQNNLLLIARDKEVVVGWLMRIPYTNTFQELAACFVEKPHRSKGVFGKLIEQALLYTHSSCIVTFNSALARHLLHTSHFRISSLREATWFSKGKFLTHRLSLSRLSSIKNHYKKDKPIYIIFSKS